MASFLLRVGKPVGSRCGLCWGCIVLRHLCLWGLQGHSWDLAATCSGLCDSGACCGRCWVSASLSARRPLQVGIARRFTASNLDFCGLHVLGGCAGLAEPGAAC